MMKTILILFSTLLFLHTNISCAQENEYNDDTFKIQEVKVTHEPQFGVTIWTISVYGKAGETKPTKIGRLDRAPVLGYVFPTTLKPTDVGFGQADGIVALAVTAHPDFDDTPLWDENSDTLFNNDGNIWHPHWVILRKDERVPGGFPLGNLSKMIQPLYYRPLIRGCLCTWILRAMPSQLISIRLLSLFPIIV